MGTEPAEEGASQEAKSEKPNGEQPKPVQAAAQEGTQSQPAALSPWIWVALVFALVISALQQADISSTDNAMQYWKELTGPHVVQPPRASDDEVVIQFCQSCGTNGLYNQISHIIHNQASRSLSVRPAAYPPHPAAALAAQVVTMAQLAGIMSLFLFDKALPDSLRENKLMACFSLWMGGSMFSGALTKTSAFEIYLGRTLVWSSLKHKRHPNIQDLVKGFAKAGVQIQ